MKYAPIDLSELKLIATDIKDRLVQEYPSIWNDPHFHDIEYFRDLCKKLSIRVLEGYQLDGVKEAGIALKVKGFPFIVMALQTDYCQEKYLRTFAHELGHILLGHLSRPNLRIIGLSRQNKDRDDINDQLRYQRGNELEAELCGMMLIVPDNYLNRFVKKIGYIPAKQIASELRISVKWIAGRIQLYRLIYGYDETRRVLKAKLDNPLGNVDINKYIKIEFPTANSLMSVLSM